jgi:hypothetical protein
MCELLPPAWIAQSLAVSQKPVVCVMNVALMMTKKVEQHICFKFCQKLGQSAQKTMI